jgi:hypothetical protein
MTISYLDMVKVDTVSTGTGSLVYGSAVTSPSGQPYLAPTSGDNGKTVVIRIESVNSNQVATTDWEECESVLTFSTKTFSRGTLRASSTGSRIAFAAGTKHIRITVGAQEFSRFVPSSTDPATAITLGSSVYLVGTNVWMGIGTSAPQEEFEIVTRSVGGGMTITSPRNAALAGHVYMRHMRGTVASPLPLHEYDYGGALYYAGIESDGQEQVIAVIYGQYGGDNHGRIVFGVNRTPDNVGMISSGPNYGGFGFFLSQGGFEDPLAGVHTFPPASNPTMQAAIFHGAASQTGNIVDIRSQANVNYSGFDYAGRPYLIGSTAPADGELAAGECRLYFDSTNGAPKLRMKAKQANGTVVAGSVNLA